MPKIQTDDSDPPHIPNFIENSAILRQLFYDRRFRFGALAVALAMAAVGLCVPRLFRVSPPGVSPPLKVSLLAMLQATTLARSATSHAAKMEWEDAMWSWRSALQENPGSLVNNRGVLNTLAELPDPKRKYLDFAISQAKWLLLLSGTNETDLRLAVRVFSHYSADDLITGILGPKSALLPPSLLAEHAKSSLRLGNPNEFAETRSRILGKIEATNEWTLYDAAWRWGWGPVGGASQAREELLRAAADPGQSTAARRLILQVTFLRNDLGVFRESFDKLVQEHADRVVDHINFWELLSLSGRKSEAIERAKAFPNGPQTATELILLTRSLASLGLRNEAIEVIQKHRAQFAYSSDVWSRQADLYIDAEDWKHLRELAIDLRGDSVQKIEMPGYGWFLEGLASKNMGAGDNAKEQFAKAAELQIKPVLIAYRTATTLGKLGYPEYSSKILARLEQWFGGSDEYWFSLALAGYHADDFELFRTASQRAYALAPTRLAVINNYAAALLLLRELPADAVRLTMECIAAKPENAGFRINHALALILNNQMGEASKVLLQLDEAKLPDDEKSLYHYAFFQIHYAAGDTNQSRQQASRIDLRHLRAEQLKWMKVALEKTTGVVKGT
ncbi:MAG TPA: hypothetical protein VMF06_01475 [Candidatus Limnocylindria bacterium]|nr:hypothetical protein [Candidatus Limnocylindria bacterium]